MFKLENTVQTILDQDYQGKKAPGDLDFVVFIYSVINENALT